MVMRSTPCSLSHVPNEKEERPRRPSLCSFVRPRNGLFVAFFSGATVDSEVRAAIARIEGGEFNEALALQ